MNELTEHTTEELIAEGRQLVSIIEEAKDGLKKIEEELRTRALAMPHEPLADKDREGRRAILKDGQESVSVLFESDLLKASFDAAAPLAKSLKHILGESMPLLFRRRQTYERKVKDGNLFRKKCHELFSETVAGQVISMLKDKDKNGIVKSKVSVEWNRGGKEGK